MNEQIIEKIKNAKKIAIFSHRDPDPDACGSMFGLREFCRAMGKDDVTVFVKEIRGKYLNHIFPLEEAREDFVASEYDLVIFVDIHKIDRIDRIFHEELEKVEDVLVVDHHPIAENEDFRYTTYNIEIIASCSQQIIELYKEAGLTPTPNAATYIYAGIMGDTDRFLHSNLSHKVFEDAMYLLDNGADTRKVYDYMYRYKTREQIRFNQYFLNNIKFIENDTVAYIVVSEKDIKKLGIDREDVKFFSNEMTKIKDVVLSFLGIEFTGGRYKVSLRSVGDLDTNILANRMGGGGHTNASGFELAKTTKKEIEKNIPAWAKEILGND